MDGRLGGCLIDFFKLDAWLKEVVPGTNKAETLISQLQHTVSKQEVGLHMEGF